jgi:cell volume regulation protein A
VPRPLSESGTIRRLGAEIVEYRVALDDAIVGARVRDLGLPREALVNVIVRGSEALPPRGSTRVAAGDELHVLVRQEASRAVPELLRRWHTGPIGQDARPRRTSSRGRAPIFQVRRWEAFDGDPTRPQEIGGSAVVDRLRTRADVAGGLFLLDDGRFAVTGPLLLVGGRTLVTQHARRRLSYATTDAERSWWEEVIGAVAL